MCRQLGVTRAAYYKWLARDIPEGEKENETIAQLIREYDDRFNHILGYRRMTDWINRLNSTNYSRNRIHRIMKELKIHSVIRRKKKKYADSTPEATAENTLSRDFNAERPNQKWATDVTEFKWYEGPVVHKLYLSAILDLYDRSIVAYVVSAKNDNKLVFDTFEQAILANPDAHPLFHSDRGFQYTSKVFQFKLSQQAMEQSMSRVGHCIDNCPTEGFWGILKAEMYYLAKFSTEVELRAAMTSTSTSTTTIDFRNDLTPEHLWKYVQLPSLLILQSNFPSPKTREFNNTKPNMRHNETRKCCIDTQ